MGDFNINVNAVAPGLTWTPAMQSTFTEEQAQSDMVSKQCLKRFTLAKHVAEAVVFLASDDADQITGQTLAVNGGEYLH
jgi:NAD(P)-dependent dehydrogenase (short-subunit alcohol dehydrogenase family)